MAPEEKRPTIVETLGPLLALAPAEDRAVLVALAERIAAGRYRSWAFDVQESGDRLALLACADREEEIARRVEALNSDSAAIQKEFAANHPDLEARYQSIFGSASLEEQFRIQAEAEHAGATTWRSFATQEGDPAVAEVFRSCAKLEEESAAVLESLQGRNPGGR